jgi:hypothetical protein
MIQSIGFLIIVAASFLFLVYRWNEAKQKRDVADMLRPYAGLSTSEKPSSAFWYLFK